MFMHRTLVSKLDPTAAAAKHEVFVACPFVILEVKIPDKLGPAHVTLDVSLQVLRSHVTVEVEAGSEHLTANVAGVLLLPVQLHVLDQAALVFVAVAANLAEKRPNVTVYRRCVKIVAASSLDLLPADVTGVVEVVRAYPMLELQMGLQVLISRGPVVAKRAFEGLFAMDRLDVPIEVSKPGEVFPTFITVSHKINLSTSSSFFWTD